MMIGAKATERNLHTAAILSFAFISTVFAERHVLLRLELAELSTKDGARPGRNLASSWKKLVDCSTSFSKHFHRSTFTIFHLWPYMGHGQKLKLSSLGRSSSVASIAAPLV